MPWDKVEGSGKWDWDKVKEFIGVKVSAETKTGTAGKPYELFTFKEETTGEEFKFSGAVLESKLANVVDGDKVKLTYHGVKRSQNGQFKDFEVEVWRD